MNGMIWVKGTLIPIEEFAKMLAGENKRREEDGEKILLPNNKNNKNMKKIIFAAIIFLMIIPATCFGEISPGQDGIDIIHNPNTCIVWRESFGQPYYNDSQGKTGNWCSGDKDQTRRIYELELAVQSLQKQVAQGSQCGCSASTTDGRIKILEEKMAYVEQMVDRLQTTIAGGLKSIIALLIK
ncbi:MAG: hypothetical protein PHN89_00530 [Candidatus Pacebacteria bacterium]|nr:hypothetical protein [Candidatus Paceibacterota bacterium]